MARTRAQTKETDPLNSGSASSSSSSPSKSGKSKSSSRHTSSSDILINDVPLSVYARNILIGLVMSITAQSAIAWLVHTNQLPLTGNIAVDKISGFGSKLEFTLRFLIAPVTCLLANLMIVMISRCRNVEAIDPLNDHEDVVLIANNTLRNTTEQLILSSLSQLLLTSYLSANEIVKVIPFMNLTFLIGRIAFIAGYPKYRTFGFAMTFFPSAIAVCFVAYKFIVTTFLNL